MLEHFVFDGRVVRQRERVELVSGGRRVTMTAESVFELVQAVV